MPSGDYLDDVHQYISEFADRFLEEDERPDFIDTMLERQGYQRDTHWVPPDPQQQRGGRQPVIGRQRQQQQGGGQRGGQGQQQGGGQRGGQGQQQAQGRTGFWK